MGVYLFEYKSQLAPLRVLTLSSDTAILTGPGERGEVANSRCYLPPLPLFIYKCPCVRALVLHSNLHNQSVWHRRSFKRQLIVIQHLQVLYVDWLCCVERTCSLWMSIAISLTVNKWSKLHSALRDRTPACILCVCVHDFIFTPCSKMILAHLALRMNCHTDWNMVVRPPLKHDKIEQTLKCHMLSLCPYRIGIRQEALWHSIHREW